MLNPVYTRQFERDIKRMKRRGKNSEKLKIIIRSLISEESLDPIHRDHKLIGNWQGRRECHIESDWLLIYKSESDRIVFERTGSQICFVAKGLCGSKGEVSSENQTTFSYSIRFSGLMAARYSRASSGETAFRDPSSN